MRTGASASASAAPSFLIDTGMLASYVPGGRASALEIADGTVSAIYAGGQRQVIWQRPRAAGMAIPLGPRRPVAAIDGSEPVSAAGVGPRSNASRGS